MASVECNVKSKTNQGNEIYTEKQIQFHRITEDSTPKNEINWQFTNVNYKVYIMWDPRHFQSSRIYTNSVTILIKL